MADVLHDDGLDARLGDLSVFSLTTMEDPSTDPTRTTERTVVRGLEIFRAGSFRDSSGVQRDWTIPELWSLADNFHLLKSRQFPNVPVRTDHSQSVLSVVGYIDNITVVSDRLVADVEFTEPEHHAKFNRGTYRARSVEIGKYEDNDGVSHWPVVLGLAFVDIPAVEGLHRGSQAVRCFAYQEETPVPEGPKEPTFTFRIGGQETTDFGKVQAHVTALEDENGTLKNEVQTLTGRNEALETFAKEQTKNTRHNFVSSLAEAKKIAATQIAALQSVVEGMSDEQFEAFQKAYEGAPALGILGDHSAGATSNPEGEPKPGDDELKVVEETIAMHRRAGMTDDEVERTPTYRKYVALTGQK